MDVSNENQKTDLSNQEKDQQNNEKKEGKILEVEQKEKNPSIKNRYGDNDIESILNKNPLEELKIIKKKIQDENSKIKQINSQLEKINNINTKPNKKRRIDFNDDYDTYTNSKRKSNLLSPKILVSSSQQITKNNPLTLDPSLNLIYQKMENLKKIRIEKINSNEEDDLSEKRKSSNENNKKLDLRILALEEKVKKDKEEKQKKYESKAKLFREKELERQRQRKKLINQINNISVSPKNKYLPKKDYITAEEREEIRKMKEESLLKLEKEKRKAKYLPISSEELDNFSRQVRKNEKILHSELDKKSKQMEELWKERKNLLPKYHSKFMDLNINLDNEAKDARILEYEKIRNKELEKMNYGKDVIKNFQPKKRSDKLKTELEQRIKELNGVNRFDNIKQLGNKLKQKSIKIVQSQPKNFKSKNLFVYEDTVGEKQAKKLSTKPPVDFLLQCRQKKSQMDQDKVMLENSNKKIKEWKEMLDSGGKNAYNNVERIKMQAAVLNNKANDINQLLKQEQNSSKKDELSQEASNLYMNSIQAKLQILNKLMTSEN